ncbi:Metallo-hydrolase/oxidoreductase [Coprinopsis marcescibilis]|uniref:Metallo-hydrolase/oxidoreductase n=1 Tax=Coprinopsis marcescibilis TaxID=230819 RepID=A0A5C3KPN3_COPMA|nr:Metallo-hydrolase/oxidoreductase [Coprinopsis marcescibilis]
MKRLTLDVLNNLPPIQGQGSNAPPPPASLRTKISPSGNPQAIKDGSIQFIGNATTLLEWKGVRLMTDPNFLHAGDHVHLGPGVTATRLKNPAIDLQELPRIDAVLLSHYHEDHFDRQVEDSLRRDLPIITTPHAYQHLAEAKPANEAFTQVHALQFFESMLIEAAGERKGPIKAPKPGIKVTGIPGKHVPPGPANVFGAANDLFGLVPPTNGWMLELGYYTSSEPASEEEDFTCGYRIYISGDTLMVDELKQIPERYKGQKIDLMLVHLAANLPLLMVTMDANQGLQLVQLINPEMTIPIHFDDYDVFKSTLDDFKQVVAKAGLDNKVVHLDRGDRYQFSVLSVQAGS